MIENQVQGMDANFPDGPRFSRGDGIYRVPGGIRPRHPRTTFVVSRGFPSKSG